MKRHPQHCAFCGGATKRTPPRPPCAFAEDAPSPEMAKIIQQARIRQSAPHARFFGCFQDFLGTGTAGISPYIYQLIRQLEKSQMSAPAFALLIRKATELYRYEPLGDDLSLWKELKIGLGQFEIDSNHQMVDVPAFSELYPPPPKAPRGDAESFVSFTNRCVAHKAQTLLDQFKDLPHPSDIKLYLDDTLWRTLSTRFVSDTESAIRAVVRRFQKKVCLPENSWIPDRSRVAPYAEDYSMGSGMWGLLRLSYGLNIITVGDTTRIFVEPVIQGPVKTTSTLEAFYIERYIADIGGTCVLLSTVDAGEGSEPLYATLAQVQGPSWAEKTILFLENQAQQPERVFKDWLISDFGCRLCSEQQEIQLCEHVGTPLEVLTFEDTPSEYLPLQSTIQETQVLTQCSLTWAQHDLVLRYQDTFAGTVDTNAILLFCGQIQYDVGIDTITRYPKFQAAFQKPKNKLELMLFWAKTRNN